MMSLARLTSRTICSSDSSTSPTLGSGLRSHRKLAWALAAIAVSGWLISCPIEAVIAASVVRRAACASSRRTLCSRSSAASGLTLFSDTRSPSARAPERAARVAVIMAESMTKATS